MHKSSHVIVKSHHPRKRQVLLAISLLVVVLAGWSLYEYGRIRGGYDSTEASKERDGLLEVIAGLEGRNSELSAQLAILQQASEVDHHAYAEVDQTLKALQDELLELREEVAFYRGIVGPADISKGLQIQSFMVKHNGQFNGYRYRLILTQYGKHSRPVQGVAKMTVLGVLEGRKKQFSLKELDTRQQPYMKFRFKYFQELNGDMELPEGFVPLRVILKTIPQGKGARSTEKTFNWAEVISQRTAEDSHVER
ncbi:MAG: DUF6776 family protein [Gammaproteobacteria bacterium]